MSKKEEKLKNNNTDTQLEESNTENHEAEDKSRVVELSDMEKEKRREIQNQIIHSDLSFLFGAGTSFCAGLPLMSKLTENVQNNLKDSCKDKDEEIEIIEAFFREGLNIEDILSDLQNFHDLLTKKHRKEKSPALISLNSKQIEIDIVIKLMKLIKEFIKEDLKFDKISGLNNHRKFINGVHKARLEGRKNRSTNYFILNYDVLIEESLALENIHYCDGFIGGATAYWCPNIFFQENKNLQAKVYKLHGSIDWIKLRNNKLPFRAREGLIDIKDIELDPDEPIIIYPAKEKYIEAQKSPYAQLIGAMRQELSNCSSHTLIISGYSFGDEHINDELINAFSNNNKLNIIIFYGEDEPNDFLKNLKSQESSGNNNISIYGKKFFWESDSNIETSPDFEFNWYKFEELSKIIIGEE